MSSLSRRTRQFASLLGLPESEQRNEEGHLPVATHRRQSGSVSPCKHFLVDGPTEQLLANRGRGTQPGEDAGRCAGWTLRVRLWALHGTRHFTTGGHRLRGAQVADLPRELGRELLVFSSAYHQPLQQLVTPLEAIKKAGLSL